MVPPDGWRHHSAVAGRGFTEYEGNMTKSADIFAPSAAPLDIALLVLPQASIWEVAATLDPMRSANRHLGYEAFRWRVVSPDGAAVPLTCGIELPSVGGLAAAAGADVLIVVAGFQQAEVADGRLIRLLARMAGGFRAVGGIDAGAWVLARAGLLEGRRATVHWEDLEDFAASWPGVEVVPDRFVIHGPRFTAGGAAPAADLMLHLIERRLGAPLALQVAGSFLYEARAGAEPQVVPRHRPLADPRVGAAISRMEAALEEPEPVAAVAAAVGLSVRRLEALFRADLGMGPGAYALDLRLQAARRMVVDTRHPLQVVAVRCGFTSQSAFARAFQRRFGQSASAARGAGNGPRLPDAGGGLPVP